MTIEFLSDRNHASFIDLNPCSNGMTIEFLHGENKSRCNAGLNPCSNGITIEFFAKADFANPAQ